jgi:hypothetical protein
MIVLVSRGSFTLYVVHHGTAIDQCSSSTRGGEPGLTSAAVPPPTDRTNSVRPGRRLRRRTSARGAAGGSWPAPRQERRAGSGTNNRLKMAQCGVWRQRD